jgi:hypothetical protein
MGLVLVLFLLLPLRASEPEPVSKPDVVTFAPAAPGDGPLLCLDLQLLIIRLAVEIGGPCHLIPPPPPPPPTTTTTTTSTTTTTAPPPPPPTTTTTTTTAPPPPPPLRVAPPTTTTTTTTAPPPPPPPPPPPLVRAPPAPQLSVSARFTPNPAVMGEPVTATLTVRNGGSETVPDVVLTDEVSASATVRSATTPGGTCAVAGRRVECRLGALAPGASATVDVHLLVEREPIASTVVQQISLGGAGQAVVVDRSLSALVESGVSPSRELLALPGPTVTLVAFVGFVLASGKAGS